MMVDPRPEHSGPPLLMEAPTSDYLAQLANGPPQLALKALRAGYGKTEVLHGIELIVGRGQSLCIIGPNGSGKSTVLNATFGLAEVHAGCITLGSNKVTTAPESVKLIQSKVSYVLQTSSIFPDMSVEDNLLMGGHLLKSRREASAAVERILDTHPRIAALRDKPAGVLSGGERRVLELSRALIKDPEVLLVDEPSIGLEPRAIDAVFEMLERLQHRDGKTILLVEQNVRKGLKFADLGYLLVGGRVAIAGTAGVLLENPRVGQLFMGG
jgi:branched-chain amino acid transport system ATP-binding protein